MRKRIRKLNNHGSTLLTVIICLAFLGILGSIMLSATMTNLQMKIVESESKKNFYSCEMAMEEIRVGLQELTAKSIHSVYETKVLPSYAYYLSKSEEDRKIWLQDLVVNELIGQIGTISEDMFDQFLSDAANSQVLVEAIEGYLASSGGVASVLIKKIHISYDTEDYQTSISSDIRITIPEFSFDQGEEVVNASMVQPYKDYVLVADGGIIAENRTNHNGTNEIKGSIYAGNDGIKIHNTVRNGGYEVIIDGDNIVTRGNITVSDTAKLTVGNTKAPIIWADNLVTATSTAYEQSGSRRSTIMDINGVSIIQDDLVVEGLNSDVTLSGAYVGYTGLHTSEGSAMMVNGSGSSLNLYQLATLILAGRAHVSVEDLDLNKDSDILTGESIAFKSNQRAYLVPGKFITNVLHNPVTEADIRPEGETTPRIPNIVIENDADINYADYVAGSPNPFKIAAKQTIAEGGLATTLRYYYLNFGSGKQADDYLQVFASKYPSVLNQMAPFALGNVTLPGLGDSEVASIGNRMAYAGGMVQLTPGLSTSLHTMDPVRYPNDASFDNYMAAITLNPNHVGAILGGRSISQLNGLYSRMSHLLTLEGASRIYQEADQVVEAALIPGGINYIYENVDTLSNPNIDFIKYQGSSYTFHTTGSSNQSFVIVDGDAVIDRDDELNGILIASGNITIGEGAIINGLVISTGETGDGNIHVGDGVTVKGRFVAANNIYLGTGCTLMIDDEVENNFIAPIFTREGALLRNLFKNTETTVNFVTTEPASNLVDLSMSNLITYENWKKN